MKKLLFALALVLGLLPAAAWSMSSTTNYDFEGTYQTGDEPGAAPGWYNFKLGDAAPVSSEETGSVHKGASAQKVDATDADGGVKALFTATQHSIYTITVWYKVTSGTASIAVSPTAEETPENMTGWKTLEAAPDWQSVTLTTVAKTPKITIFLRNTGGVSYWDDISLVESTYPLPPPGPMMRLWAETVWWQRPENGHPANGAGNPIGHGQVLVDGDKTIIAEGEAGVLMYGDEQKDGTAFLQSTPFWGLNWPNNYTSKAGTMMNGYLYSQDMFYNIYQTTPWSNPWGTAMVSGRDYTDADCNGLVTDGTYLYGSENTGAWNDGVTKIYKWAVDPAANGGNGSLTIVPGWPVTIPRPNSWCSSLGYYNGKLYAAEAFFGRNIFEIDCATGAITPLLSGANLIPSQATTDIWYMGQVARCGDTLVLGTWNQSLITWKLIDGVWTIQSFNNFQVGDLGGPNIIGLSLKPGPDGNAKYMWMSVQNVVNFWDLTPFSGGVTDLGDPMNWKQGYPVYTKAVVTAHAPSQGFWVENQSRTTGAFVAYQGALPAVGKFVTIKAMASKNDGGEKILTPIAAADAVVEGETADPGVEPLIMTGKSLGSSATGIGVATDGMLVKITGKVTGHTIGTEFPGAIYLDDGSSLSSGQPDPAIGVKVTRADGLELYDESDPVENIYAVVSDTCYATVTGIVRIRKVGDIYVREIQVRSGADVKITVQ